MNSSRLPGKALMKICGKPILQHIIERLQYCKLIDKIIIVTSTNKENNAIEKLCKQLKISCFRGSEDDVFERFKGAIKAFDIKDDDKIIRITGDCPMCDPELIDVIINRSGDLDLTTNCIERTFPDGLDIEVFKTTILQNPHFNEINFFEIEYSLDFLQNKNFTMHNVANITDLSHLRWTLDTAEDFEFIKSVYERLYQEGKIFLMNDILKIK
jgi:spore coat polysaccharide biosynthesis protein SpsF (cytidylyltransferase family)